MKSRKLIIAVPILLALLGAAVVGVLAQMAESKPFIEGAAGLTGMRLETNPLRVEAEGLVGETVQSPEGELQKYEEGTAGRTGTALLSDIPSNLDETDALAIRYRFSGVTDDGQKGAATRKEATSILCTNIGAAVTQIEIRLYNWNGGDFVYTGTVFMSPNASFTFSTQNTTIYFDDVIFGTGGGTDAIFQGSAVILSELDTVICSAQVLDPLGYPPVYISALEIYRR